MHCWEDEPTNRAPRINSKTLEHVFVVFRLKDACMHACILTCMTHTHMQHLVEEGLIDTIYLQRKQRNGMHHLDLLLHPCLVCICTPAGHSTLAATSCRRVPFSSIHCTASIPLLRLVALLSAFVLCMPTCQRTGFACKEHLPLPARGKYVYTHTHRAENTHWGHLCEGWGCEAAFQTRAAHGSRSATGSACK